MDDGDNIVAVRWLMDAAWAWHTWSDDDSRRVLYTSVIITCVYHERARLSKGFVMLAAISTMATKRMGNWPWLQL